MFNCHYIMSMIVPGEIFVLFPIYIFIIFKDEISTRGSLCSRIGDAFYSDAEH